jgi:transcriptional regulator
VYVPPAFRPRDVRELYDVMERHSLATLVMLDGGAPAAVAAPFVLRSDERGCRRLWGHIARANPHGAALQDEQEVLVLFQGPGAYVSPSFYHDAPNVPTWNFVAVHAYGRPRVLRPGDPRVRWIIEQTVAQYERLEAEPWTVQEAGDYVDELLPGVLAFEVELTRVEGQFKLSQNQPPGKIRAVIEGLERRGDEQSNAVAALMRDRGP